MKTSSSRVATRAALSMVLLAGSALASAAIQDAQQQPQPNSATSLQLPQELVVYGTPLQPVVKASVLVNGEVITQTDVEQRIGLLTAGGERPAAGAQLDQLRQQVLANLIDETLQIQAAKREEIEVKKADVDTALRRFAEANKQTVESVGNVLLQSGSSVQTLRRQIEAQIAWRRLQSAKIESGVSVGDDEVKAVLDKLEAAKGTEEFQVAEIFLSGKDRPRDQVYANAMQVIEALQKGAPFDGIARQYSEASTAAVGGDLGWVRPEQLPDPLAQALQQLKPGTVSPPIEVAGGFSILALRDSRKVLVADPRDAVLNLKQVSVSFDPSLSKPAVEARLNAFVAATRSIGGCGGAEKLAADFNGEVVQSDQVKLKELPDSLQEMLGSMQIGQATQPFGDPGRTVRTLVLCGRDLPDAALPSYDQVMNRLNEERVNVRARRYLRDLRRDAFIDFR